MDLSPDGEVLATASETVCFYLSLPRHHAMTLTSLLIKGTLVRVFSTSNCARIAELRRGIDHALIYSIAISPSSTLLAVTSDKSTLHIFDLPHPLHPPRTEWTNNSRPYSSSGSAGGYGPGDEKGSQKWGILSKIPLLPRVFSDIYSFASAHIEIGDNPQISGGGASGPVAGPIPGIPGGRPPKGIIGWTNDHTVIVIGAGRDGRWEKFVVGEGEDGKRRCVRDGWRRYLGGA
ncbi:Phosphatidylinositol 3,5-bisphosphate-binding protein [Acarospora aff. strigata]|nr:Phosphatidylinositol 3,5-bisphosphate-binding protein [Acarospora aff. strigata]